MIALRKTILFSIVFLLLPFTVYDVSDEHVSIVKGIEKKSQTLNKAIGSTVTQIKIMPLGDSITEGGGDDSTSAGYRSKLFDLLEAAGYNFDFVGSLSSGTSYTFNTNFDQDHEGQNGMEVGPPSYLSLPTMVENIGNYLTNNLPDIVLFHMGTDDLNHFDADDQIASQLSAVNDSILKYNPSSRIFLAKIIHNNHVSETNLNIAIQSMYDTLTSGKKKKIKLVDMHSSPQLIYPTDFSFSSGGSDYSDLHPVRTGYDKMADKWFAALQNYYQPELVLPSNDTTDQPVDVTLNWIASPVASDNSVVYQVQISTDSTFTTLILNNQSVDSTSMQVSGLLQCETEYYWRVRIPNYGWSTVWNFTTMPIPAVAMPTNLKAVQNPANFHYVKLTWVDNSPNELGFTIERKLGDSLSIADFINIGLVNANVIFYEDTIVVDSTTYTYRVYAFTTVAVSNYSNLAQITTSVPVELISFTAKVMDERVQLNWETATEINNEGFSIQRSTDKNKFINLAFIKGKGTTTFQSFYSYSDNSILSGKYFYRIKQVDFDGASTYSKELEVLIDQLIKNYVLEQNFSNPFNPTTTIGFGIPEKGNVRLSVLNILGEEIRVLINEEKEAGYHSVDFIASDLPSGVYFYRLQSGNFIDMKKMILMK